MNEAWHGTSGGYSNHQCRCDECKAAWATTNREYKRRRTAEANGYVEGAKHGTDYAYHSGCRCDNCKRAHADYNAELQRKRRERIAQIREARNYRARIPHDHMNVDGTEQVPTNWSTHGRQITS